MNNKPTLLILQYNVMRSRNKVMASLLRDDRIRDFDVIALQEPWKNSQYNTTHNPNSRLFELVYLDDAGTRTCFFVSKRIPTAQWTVTHHSPDLSTLIISCSGQGMEEIIHIHNVYNPPADTDETTIPLLREVLHKTTGDKHIVLGDFNLHHPHWSGDDSTRQHSEAEELLQLVLEHHMELLLPPGSVTFDERGGATTIDLAFGTPWIQERKSYCGVPNDLDHQSDHLPIATTIMTTVTTSMPQERWQWQRTDEKTMNDTVRVCLPRQAPLGSPEAIDRRVQEIVAAITKAIKKSTPKARPSEESKPGWTQECKDAQMTARRLRRRYQRTRSESD
jgi:exonuclease III